MECSYFGLNACFNVVLFCLVVLVVSVSVFFLLGEYWIDPNEGVSDDAIKVFCHFGANASCFYPHRDGKVSNFVRLRRLWDAIRELEQIRMATAT